MTPGGTRLSIVILTISVGDAEKRLRRPRRKVVMLLNLTSATLKTKRLIL